MNDNVVLLIAICLCIVLVVATVSWPDFLGAIADFLERIFGGSGGNGSGNGNGNGNGHQPPQHTTIDDDFNIIRDWWEKDSTWSYTADGRLRQTGTTIEHRFCLNNYSVFQDGELTADVWLESSSPRHYVWLCLRMSGGTGYIAGIHGIGHGTWAIGKAPMLGEINDIKKVSHPVQDNYKYTMTFKAVTIEDVTQLTLTVNGVVLIECTDIAYQRAGQFGFGVYCSHAQFDNMHFVGLD